MTFGKRLKELRAQANMTQGDLAKATGLKQSSIAMYEIDKRTPKIDVLERFADFFQVDIDFLIGKSDGANLGNRLRQKSDFIKWAEKIDRQRGTFPHRFAMALPKLTANEWKALEKISRII